MKKVKWQIWLNLALLVSIILLVIIFSPKSSPNNSSPTATQYSTLTSNAEFPFQVPDGIVYVNPDSNQITKISFSNQATNYLTLPQNPIDMICDPTGSLVAALFRTNDINVNQWNIFDLKSGKQISQLNPNINALSFSKDGQRIAYVYDDGSTRTLNTSDLSGKDWQMVLALPQPIARLWWLQVQTQVVLLTNSDQPVYLGVALSSKQFTTIGNGDSIIKESPNGSLTLFGNQNVSDQQAPLELSVGQANVDGITNLEKLTFNNSVTDLSTWNDKSDALYTFSFDNAGVVNSLYKYTLSDKKTTKILDQTQLDQILQLSQNGLIESVIGKHDQQMYLQLNHSIVSFQVN
jgi:hypothetical protein